MAAIYTVFTSPYHPPIPDHLPTLVVTPHGQPTHVLYSYLHTDFNKTNYLLTPSPQGDLCVAKLFPPSKPAPGAASDPGHGASRASRSVRCEASRELKWSIENTGVRSPIYKIVNKDDTPLYQISKPNPNADFWTMFYYAYAGHQIPPRRAEFGKIQKNPPEKGGGTRITITGKTEDEKRVWQTLGEGNEDCVEWVVCCAALNLLDDEILKAAGASNPPPESAPPSNGIASSQPFRNQAPPMVQAPQRPGQALPAPSPRLASTAPQQLRDNGPVPQGRPSPSRMGSSNSATSHHNQHPPPQQSHLRPQQGGQHQYGHPQQQQQYGHQPPRSPGGGPDPRMIDPRGRSPQPPPQQGGGYDPRYGPPLPQQQQQQRGYPQQQGPPQGQQRGPGGGGQGRF